MLKQQDKDQARQDYMAQVLWTLGKRWYKEYPLPPWSELMGGKPKRPADMRSGKQILLDTQAAFAKAGERT